MINFYLPAQHEFRINLVLINMMPAITASISAGKHCTGLMFSPELKISCQECGCIKVAMPRQFQMESPANGRRTFIYGALSFCLWPPCRSCRKIAGRFRFLLLSFKRQAGKSKWKTSYTRAHAGTVFDHLPAKS